MAGSPPVVALTAGEPAGIGPDLCALLAAGAARPGPVVFLGDRQVVAERARMRGLRFEVPDYHARRDAPAFSMLHLPVARPVTPGRLDVANGPHVLALLDRAVEGCLAGEFDAMVTAPVQKSTIAESGVDFMGHTEYLAGRTGTPRVVMMLAGGGLRVALATTHLALADVPRAITREALGETLDILDRDLRERFRIAHPRILVAGLNPHAGESGHLGREEIEVIGPAIEAARARGIDARGPYPADTLYTKRMMEGADATLAMFHDQGLPVLKHAAFGDAINVTLGLPIVRTSVDHGTALDRAGHGEVDAGSLAAALDLAFELAPRGRA